MADAWGGSLADSTGLVRWARRSRRRRPQRQRRYLDVKRHPQPRSARSMSFWTTMSPRRRASHHRCSARYQPGRSSPKTSSRPRVSRPRRWWSKAKSSRSRPRLAVAAARSTDAGYPRKRWEELLRRLEQERQEALERAETFKGTKGRKRAITAAGPPLRRLQRHGKQPTRRRSSPMPGRSPGCSRARQRATSLAEYLDG